MVVILVVVMVMVVAVAATRSTRQRLGAWAGAPAADVVSCTRFGRHGRPGIAATLLGERVGRRWQNRCGYGCGGLGR